MLLLISIAVPIPALVMGAAWALVLVPALWPSLVVRLTGGSRPLDSDVEAAVDTARQAWARYEDGDLDAGAAWIDRLDAMRTTNTSRYVDLWQRYAAHAQESNAEARLSQEWTLEQIRLETVQIASRGPTPRRSRWAAVILAAVIGASPTLIAARACIGVELLLPSATTEFTSAVPPFLDNPERGAQLVSDLALNLEQEASTRHDPDSHQQLVDAGFQVAFHRVWLTPKGEQIEASEAIFGDADGALRFHQQVNRHACQFSNEAFAGPEGSVGLQVRYSTGPHPIVEQVSWVFGARRYVVSVGTVVTPPNHQRVLDLAERAMEDPGL